MVGFSEYKQQQTESTQRQVDKDNIFLTENYGGLNLESSSVNMPLSDSPSLLNIEIESSGKIRKRRGSRVLNNYAAYVDCHVPYKLIDGTLIHILISHDTLYVVKDGYATTVLYSSVVFPSVTYVGAYQPKTNHALISYDDMDVIVFTRESACPVVLLIRQEKGNPTAATYVFRDALLGTRRDTTKTSNCYYEQSGTFYTVSSIVAGVATLGSTPTAGVPGTFFTLHVGWCAETMWCPKDSVTNSLVFPQVAPGVDNVQELKPVMQRALLQDMYPAQVNFANMTGVSTLWAGGYNGVVATSNPFDLTPGSGLLSFYYLGYANPQQIPWATANLTLLARPTWGESVNPGAWQIGSVTSSTSADNTNLQVGYSAITFGGLRYTDAAYTVPGRPVMPCMMRIIYLPLNGGAGIQARYTLVVDDLTQYSWDGTATRFNTGAHYWLYANGAGGAAGTIVNCAANSAPGQWLRFDSGAWLGLWGNDLMVINSDLNSSYIGTSMVRQTPTSFCPTVDGGMFQQMLGLYRFSNYHTGAFPSICGTYQDRLVLADFPSAPGTILLSNSGYSNEFRASSWYGTNYKCNNFETGLADPELPTSCFSIKLNLSPDERITAFAQWYDDLFVGTTKAIYRIHGGELVAVNPQNYFVSKVASVGCVNRGMTLTEEGVCFLSEAGVFKVVINSNTGAYTVDNIGIKIRKAIAAGMAGGRFYNGSGEIAYDNKQNVLYVAVPDSSSGSTMRKTPRRLFVYYFDRKAWSEWGTVSGYFPVTTLKVADGRLFANCWETSRTPDAELRNLFIEMNVDNTFIDFVRTGTVGDLSSDDIEIQHPRGRGVWDATAYTANFAIDLKNPGFEQPIKTIPLKEAGWVTGLVGSTRKYEGTDYIRRDNNLLCTFSSFGANWFEMEQNLSSGDRPMIVWHNTESRYVAQSEYKYDVSSYGFGIRAKAAGDALDGDSVTVGLAYPTWWMSPVFTRNDITNYKRLKQFYAVFENSIPFDNVASGAAQWKAMTSFNVALIQNGARTGDYQVDVKSSDSLTDIATDEPGWNDFYRVVLPFTGNATGFQACVYSFDQHQWELTGYQIDTEVEGRTSRRADNS